VCDGRLNVRVENSVRFEFNFPMSRFFLYIKTQYDNMRERLCAIR